MDISEESDNTVLNQLIQSTNSLHQSDTSPQLSLTEIAEKSRTSTILNKGDIIQIIPLIVAEFFMQSPVYRPHDIYVSSWPILLSLVCDIFQVHGPILSTPLQVALTHDQDRTFLLLPTNAAIIVPPQFNNTYSLEPHRNFVYDHDNRNQSYMNTGAVVHLIPKMAS